MVECFLASVRPWVQHGSTIRREVGRKRREEVGKAEKEGREGRREGEKE